MARRGRGRHAIRTIELFILLRVLQSRVRLEESIDQLAFLLLGPREGSGKTKRDYESETHPSSVTFRGVFVKQKAWCGLASEHLCCAVDLLARDDRSLMGEALRLAAKAGAAGEVPIGAIITMNGRIVGRGYNQVEMLKDPTAHAEVLAITQAAAAVGDWRLTDCEMFVTKEPCPMCAGAAVHARLRRVVFGCADERAGAAGSVINLLQMPSLNHRCDINSGLLAEECAALLQGFFQSRRANEK